MGILYVNFTSVWQEINMNVVRKSCGHGYFRNRFFDDFENCFTLVSDNIYW